jgi:hypothetical protein
MHLSFRDPRPFLSFICHKALHHREGTFLEEFMHEEESNQFPNLKILKNA